MLLDTWLAAGYDDRPPSRSDLTPDAMPRILSDIWLMDYEPEGARLRYRLAGENIRARYDYPLVGKCLDEILAAEARDKVLRYFRACVEKPAVSSGVGRLYHEWDRPGYGERLLLPLLDDNGLPQGLVGITICKQTFPNRPVAELRAKRITSILPLGGAPATEEPG
ncbi:MAG: PAS domain-containing protein [Kiloniellaceae bacterium]